MRWFRKARYAVALLVIPLIGTGFTTQIGEHSLRYVVSAFLILTGMVVLSMGIEYADHSVNEWPSEFASDSMTR
jgi:hypothetical protein